MSSVNAEGKPSTVRCGQIWERNWDGKPRRYEVVYIVWSSGEALVQLHDSSPNARIESEERLLMDPGWRFVGDRELPPDPVYAAAGRLVGALDDLRAALGATQK